MKNREIKFRVWDISHKEFIPRGCYGIITTHFKAFGVMLKDWDNYKEGEYFYSYAQVLQQFTGLMDKNGKEIYKGDIVDLHQTINGVRIFTVEWCHKRMGWTLRYAENMNNPRTYEYSVSEVFAIEEIEVIGNIYQNPELLNTPS